LVDATEISEIRFEPSIVDKNALGKVIEDEDKDQRRHRENEQQRIHEKEK